MHHAGTRDGAAPAVVVTRAPYRPSAADAALLDAAAAGDEAGVARLLGLGADPNTLTVAGGRLPGNWTPLHVAAARGHGGCVARLLAAGAAVEARDDEGRTALMCADVNAESVLVALLGASCDVPCP